MKLNAFKQKKTLKTIQRYTYYTAVGLQRLKLFKLYLHTIPNR